MAACEGSSSLHLSGSLLIDPAIAAEGIASVAPPFEASGEQTIHSSVASAGEQPLRPPVTTGVGIPLITIQGQASLPPAVALKGRVAIDPPIEAGGIGIVASPIGGGGIAPVYPPVSLKGRIAVHPGPQRHLDWVLSLLVWIGTWGQNYYQNQTCVKTKEKHEEWRQRIHANREVAWRELQLAWKERLAPDRPIDPQEIAHVQAFVTILREMCDPHRLKEIYSLNKKKEDVNPPLWDSILTNYIQSHYAPNAWMGPHLENQAPPLIV